MKRNTFLTTSALVLATGLALTACSSSGGDTGSTPAADKVYNIGISQFVQHDALDAAREGFIEGLKDAGFEEGKNVKFDVQNSQAEVATASTIAAKFAADKVDLVLAIATPSAQAAAQAIIDIPVLFTAVTEPEVAGLVESWEKPGSNVTGTSDLNPVEEQIGLIKEMVPDLKSVGIVYSSGEVNSEVQVDLAKKAAEAGGFELKLATVTNSSEVAQAVESLGDVDAVYIPTDNKVTDGIAPVIQYAEKNKIPVFGSEAGQVDNGAVATYGIDYHDLGVQTGAMAAKILKGAKPADMPVETLDETQLIINKGAAARMGVTISEELLAKADKVID